MSPPRTVYAVLPGGFDDPARPSGGNTYDRRLCQELAARGWCVLTRPVAGEWPCPDQTALDDLGRVLGAVPDGSLVLVDALIGSSVPEVMVPAARRLGVVALLHMPFGQLGDAERTREREVLCAAVAVITPSGWSRNWVLDAYPLDRATVHAVEPGVDAAEVADGSDHGGNLLCVASVTRGKGHDVLLEALARVADLDWRCRCIGALTRAPEYVAELRDRTRAAGLADRMDVAGPRSAADLDAEYAGADVLVLPSRSESYGMVVTEALARGLPVLATDVGGIPEALGLAPDGTRPGLLVPADDPRSLAASLRRWLADAELRARLRDAARQRRAGLPRWSETGDRIARVLSAVAA